MNVLTVAFYCPWSVGAIAFVCQPPSDVNGQWTAALGAIEGDEPSFAAAAAVNIEVALVNHTESGITFLLFENAILQKNN